MDVETEEDRLFRAWRDTLPPAHWSTYDLAACRIGWDAGRKALGHPIQGEAVAWVSEQQLAGLRQGGQVATLWSNAPAQDYVPLFASPQPPTPEGVREITEEIEATAAKAVMAEWRAIWPGSHPAFQEVARLARAALAAAKGAGE